MIFNIYNIYARIYMVHMNISISWLQSNNPLHNNLIICIIIISAKQIHLMALNWDRVYGFS